MILKSSGEPPETTNDGLSAARRAHGRRLLLGAAALLAAAGLISSIYWPQPQVETEPKELAMGWRLIFSQAGRGTMQTESFQIDTGQWRIKWFAVAADDAGSGVDEFRVGVHSSVSGRLMNVAIDHPGVGEGIAYVAEEPRPFFLSIESSGLNWSVHVEEGVLGEREKNAPHPAPR
jgi:hypothetical protein